MEEKIAVLQSMYESLKTELEQTQSKLDNVMTTINSQISILYVNNATAANDINNLHTLVKSYIKTEGSAANKSKKAEAAAAKASGEFTMVETMVETMEETMEETTVETVNDDGTVTTTSVMKPVTKSVMKSVMIPVKVPAVKATRKRAAKPEGFTITTRKVDFESTETTADSVEVDDAYQTGESLVQTGEHLTQTEGSSEDNDNASIGVKRARKSNMSKQIPKSWFLEKYCDELDNSFRTLFTNDDLESGSLIEKSITSKKKPSTKLKAKGEYIWQHLPRYSELKKQFDKLYEDNFGTNSQQLEIDTQGS